MGLSGYKVTTAIAVSDMDSAKGFYERKLGLSKSTGPDDNRAYECGEGTVLHVYLSPEHAGNLQQPWLAGTLTTSRRSWTS